jgi:hypothetical protein
METLIATGLNTNGQLGIGSITNSFGLAAVPDTDISPMFPILHVVKILQLLLKTMEPYSVPVLNSSGQLGVNDIEQKTSIHSNA